MKYVSYKIKRHLTVDVTPIPYIYEVKKPFFLNRSISTYYIFPYHLFSIKLIPRNYKTFSTSPGLRLLWWVGLSFGEGTWWQERIIMILISSKLTARPVLTT